jgi:hypothetical protein
MSAAEAQRIAAARMAAANQRGGPSQGRRRVADAAGLPIDGAETSQGSAQTVLLGLGGLLLAGAAVVLTMIAFATVGGIGRIVVLSLVIAVALALPIVLVRRNLAETAETVAAVALLLVLLDGYVAWTLRLFGGSSFSMTTYFGLVCLGTAVISVGYHATSHLIAPRFATMLVLQPVLPLLAFNYLHTSTGWALMLAGVAVIDLGFGAGWWRLPRPLLAPLLTRVPTPLREGPMPLREDAAPAGGGRGAALSDTVLRDFAWALFAVAYAGGVVAAAISLTAATEVGPALAAATLLVIIVTLGVAGGLIWRREPMPDVMGGIATVAVVLAVTRSARSPCRAGRCCSPPVRSCSSPSWSRCCRSPRGAGRPRPAVPPP